jgi:hypothetical protein
VSDRAVWKKLSDEVERAISALDLPGEQKNALRRNVGALNNVSQRSKMEATLRAINITLSPEESQAWRRRNDAAHGNEMPRGGERALIQDTKLLK